VHISLCFNPSHLEYVNPVALGRMRAKQDRLTEGADVAAQRGMVLLIHGDAAFIGEGVVQETLNLSQLDAYATGGTLHVIVNNQVGFTTPPEQSRSSPYCTDVAKMLQIPIFHVNGEDPEAVAQVVALALDFRAEFRRDVVIDMYAYRRQGHNETDEPSFTQPLLYRAIERRKPVREGYLEHLLALGGVTREQADQIAARSRENLERELSAARSYEYQLHTVGQGQLWQGYWGGPDADVPEPDTAVESARLADLLVRQTRLPDGFQANPKIERILAARREMAAGKRPLDWTHAEALALASLATEGARIRMTGQDCERGTFSQRHAVLHDVRNGRTYVPLQSLSPDQAPVEIANSPLSEIGVLGFEYGYSLEWPDGLVLWEAQFGDFVNCAQVIVDQFIASAEAKWQRLSGIVLLLPHGLEGQGPEHSSARLERFLTMAAEDNMQIVYPTTPAQYFHVLRRQIRRPLRKPLIVMTPKSLLRHPAAVSKLSDLATGRFQRVLADPHLDAKNVRRILLCSGKVYFELLAERDKRKRRDIALVRVEQLYPLSDETLAAALNAYRDGTPAFWVQEEPENNGAWRYLRVRFPNQLLDRFPFAGIYRPAAASPASGSHRSHKLEQQDVLDRALDGIP